MEHFCGEAKGCAMRSATVCGQHFFQHFPVRLIWEGLVAAGSQQHREVVIVAKLLAKVAHFLVNALIGFGSLALSSCKSYQRSLMPLAEFVQIGIARLISGVCQGASRIFARSFQAGAERSCLEPFSVASRRSGGSHLDIGCDLLATTCCAGTSPAAAEAAASISAWIRANAARWVADREMSFRMVSNRNMSIADR
jgi:hypothetical protein